MNLYKFFYHDYFDSIDFSSPDPDIIQSRNLQLVKFRKLKVIEAPQIVNTTIRLKVEYPGLLTGAGIQHAAGIDGEFKLGVHFDYTEGMPVVYGSSVKGVLRSLFKADKEYVADSLRRLLSKQEGEHGDSLSWEELIPEEFIDCLEKNIFGSNDSSCSKEKGYEKDLFFDAVIVKPNRQGRILSADTLSPHKRGPLKNPVPISFLRIASGVTMEFRFRLTDSVVFGRRITADIKKRMFTYILLLLGVGAKTNVGYGQLSRVSD